MHRGAAPLFTRQYLIEPRLQSERGEKKKRTGGSETFLHRWRRFLLGGWREKPPRNSSNQSLHSRIMGRVVCFRSLVCLVLDGAATRRCLMRINPQTCASGLGEPGGRANNPSSSSVCRRALPLRPSPPLPPHHHLTETLSSARDAKRPFCCVGQTGPQVGS